ncbi:unnamed protein product [Caenorhabditis auriculariae]|uniref:Dopey N-terminal domain-containing protein n=1 Tax=Caenorhabditis auriculariae TaxID=2777116 RepID=A0A8S1GNJ5_9PELO|nr:unnamed protein product [Caenorhabditis auriculariae]
MSASSSGDVRDREKEKEQSSSKYKAYVQAVDRALKTFENPNEWADLISALGKLAKVFQSNAKFTQIPKPVTVAKRLSQCLHPALPMGVHIKALETYRQVFDILGQNSLPELLYLFAVGLFPLMDHCGIKVKSELFAIFEQYLLPLGPHLRPALPGFLGGVLLGLEEGTEFYERSLVLLDRVCEKVGARSFYACLWQTVLGSPPVRLPAMIYVNAKYDKQKSLDDQIYFFGDHVNHMVAALCATADDSGSPLVQRYLLDFLVTAFPLDSSNLTKEDFVQLLRRSLFVVLRRDMSLNRRLYTWLVNRSGETTGVSGLSLGGPEESLDMSFFRDHVLPMIVCAIEQYLALDIVEVSTLHGSQSMFGERKATDQVQFAEVRVCRLLLYLQDRADIGKLILDAVFSRFLRISAEYFVNYGGALLEVESKSVETRSPIQPKPSMQSIDPSHSVDPEIDLQLHGRRVDELTKTFNMLLNSLEQGFIWDFLGNWLEEIVNHPGDEYINSPTVNHYAQVVMVCLEICNLDSDVAVRILFLPTLLKRILNGLASTELLEDCKQEDVLLLFAVCRNLLQIITSRTGVPLETESFSQTETTATAESEGNLVFECQLACLEAMSSIFALYAEKRSPEHLPLIQTSSALLNLFLDIPIYVLPDDAKTISKKTPAWLVNILKVIDGPGWLSAMHSASCPDVSARAALLELLCCIYARSSSVQLQHKELSSRKSSEPSEDATNEPSHESSTILLMPLLSEDDMAYLENERLFPICAEAVWIGVGSKWCTQEQQLMSRLLLQLHSRKTNEPSSELENIIVRNLTSTDEIVCTDAAKTFHKVWVLTRPNEDADGFATYAKPFNRVVMILLGVLADESVARARTELKAAASAWFADCAKHQDLPRIVQMLSTMLMNPVTARISIQYVRQESKMTRETCPTLPSGVSAVTMITADGKQRLYHIDGPPLPEDQWLYDVRNRLLLSTVEENSVSENLRVSPCVGVCPGDVPNFDDDTDSIDTLSWSLEGVDPAVVETLQALIDTVVEDEENEMEALEKLSSVGQIIDPSGISFSLRQEEAQNSKTNDEMEPDEPKAAPVCESMQRLKKGHRRQDSLQESIFSMTEKDFKAFDATEILRSSADSVEGSNSTPLFDELHVHMLLYGESGRVVDLGRAETAFRILAALLSPRGSSGNRMLLNCLVSSGTAAQTGEDASMSNGSLVELMTRHVRAILGQHFWTSSVSEEDPATKHRHLTLLELLITISLHYLRSYFLNSPISPVTDADLVVSWKCKISALEFLSELISELASMLDEQKSRTFVIFVQSILNRSKLQKCLLHLLFTAVHHDPDAQRQNSSLSVSISEFNEGRHGEVSRRLSPLLSAYHRSLLALTSQAIRLEYEIKNGYNSFPDNTSTIGRNPSFNPQLYHSISQRSNNREPHAALVELRAFLVILLSSLKKQPQRHEMWLHFIVQILQWMERSLATIVCRVVEQLCKNVEAAMSEAYIAPITSDVVTESLSESKIEPDGFPPNYLVMILESMTTLVHFCVIDVTSIAGPSTVPTSTPPAAHGVTSSSVVGHAMSVIPGTRGATELISNLVKVFSFSESNNNGGVGISKGDGARMLGNGWRQAQSDMLSSFPHSLATICNVWTLVRTHQCPSLPLGTTSQLRRLVLQMLSPIAQHHEHAFLAALALVWLTRSSSKPTALRKQDLDKANFDYSTAQVDIANLLLSLKVIPFEELIASVNTTLKESSLKATKVGIQMDKGTFPTEEPLLELVHACVTTVPAAQLRSCWPALLNLFNEAPLSSLTPRAVFLLFVILCDFVKSVGSAYIVEEKLMSRNVHEVCQRLTEAVNVVVGWQLETTTWLKRTLVVKQDHASNSTIRSVDQSPVVENMGSIAAMSTSNISEQASISSMRASTLSLMNKPPSIDSGSSSSGLVDKSDKKSASNLRASIKDTNNNKRDPTHSTQALFLLSERLTDLLDSISKSDEKERVQPILTAVWNNVVPYLKAKNARNARFFLASSQLLASMSSYSYMRPVWKKTTLELLLDSSFFKMDHQSLKQWLVVTDHLMTHDRTSFKELLKSIAYTQNASFSIMTSKDQEHEARAQALKRLAFVVFGSQLDQYHAQMNDIQERLSDNLRVSQSPVVRSAVFLCIRVLLMRLRPQSLIGIWPIMVTELVHVLLQLEQQLNVGGNGLEELASAKDDHWMQLYLAACKLLETLCTLPAGYLSHFQMCHWAFVTSVTADRTDKFIPFAGRINELLCKKYGELSANDLATQSASLNGIKLLTSFEELRPFFYALATQNKTVPGTEPVLRDSTILTGSLSHKSAVSRMEKRTLRRFFGTFAIVISSHQL